MSKLRLIQAGVGGMGKSWWAGATRNSPDFDLVAIVDVNQTVLHDAGDQLSIPRDARFTSLQSAIDEVGSDAVLTVTPPQVHAEHAALAFSRQLHVLTEKPIAPDLAAAKKMVQQARDANRQLVVAQNYRYSSAAQKLKSLVSEKPVGDIGHGHIDFYIPADFTGSFRQSMQFPLLIDMAIHHLDLIRAVTGKNIARVIAQTFNPKWSWYDHDAGLKMLLELDDGTPFSYSGDWTARGRSTSWNGNWRLQCSDGSIHLEDDKLTVARCEKWNKNPSIESIEIPDVPLQQQQAILHNFAEAIRTNKPAETSGEDNLWSFAAVMAGSQSASERGRSIDVAALLNDQLPNQNDR